MPGKFKTEAVVLRSIRYGEADRVLHLYSATRGRIGAIAKGVRRPRSRFGGRLEPFFRLDLVLHEGRGDLATVTARPHGRGAPEPARRAAPRSTPRRAPATRCCACSTPSEANPPRLQPALPLPGDARRRALESGRRQRRRGGAGWRRRSPSGSSSRWPPASPPSSAPARAAARSRGWSASRAPPAGSSAGLRARRLPALRRGARVHGRGAGPPARRVAGRRGAGAAPGRARDHRDARAPRPRAASRLSRAGSRPEPAVFASPR